MNDSPTQPWFQPYVEFHCRDCGSETGFRSRPRTFTERYILPALLLQPVRCGECFRRDYRLIFTPVRERPSNVTRLTAVSSEPVAAKRNVA